MVGNTVTIKVGLWQGGRCGGIVKAIAIVISEVIDRAITIAIDTASFDQIIQTIVIAVEIQMIGHAVIVLIWLWQWSVASRIIKAIAVFISEVINHTVAILINCSGFKRVA